MLNLAYVPTANLGQPYLRVPAIETSSEDSPVKPHVEAAVEIVLVFVGPMGETVGAGCLQVRFDVGENHSPGYLINTLDVR